MEAPSSAWATRRKTAPGVIRRATPWPPGAKDFVLICFGKRQWPARAGRRRADVKHSRDGAPHHSTLRKHFTLTRFPDAFPRTFSRFRYEDGARAKCNDVPFYFYVPLLGFVEPASSSLADRTNSRPRRCRSTERFACRVQGASNVSNAGWPQFT